MRKGWQAPGYTIVEVMIFLAVSSMLLISGMSLVAGQQRKAEFAQAIRDTEQQIQDVINNVRTGYYPNTGGFSCNASVASPKMTEIGPGPSTPGSNNDCVYLGRVMQFNAGGIKSQYKIYSIAGLRDYTKGHMATNTIQRADPKFIGPTTETRTLKYGLEVVRVEHNNSDLGSVGFLTEPGKDAAGSLISGSQAVRLVPIGSTIGSTTDANTETALNNRNNYGTQDPPGGVTVCFKSGGTDQYGIITIGGSAGQLTTKLEIKNGPESSIPECRP